MIRTFRLYRLDKLEYLPKSEGEMLPLVKLSDLARKLDLTPEQRKHFKRILRKEVKPSFYSISE